MELSILVAKIMAVVYITIGLGFLINSAYYKKALIDMMKDSGFMLLSGMMALVIGFLLVNSHNIWVKDWTVLVTIIGWISLVKGVLIFLAPKLFTGLVKWMTQYMVVWGVLVLIFGLVFGYFGCYLPGTMEVVDAVVM